MSFRGSNRETRPVIDFYPLVWPILRRLDPEEAHRLVLKALGWGLGPKAPADAEPTLGIRVLGRDFPNPIGLAAGFDKNAEVFDRTLAMGFGFVEVGGVTPKPQDGNPRPRVFRLEDDLAIVNRMGFNNDGMDAVAARLALRAGPGIVGVNLGKNKDTADAARDYAALVERFAPLADFLTVNVSSPNTPGLRALQGRAALDDILRAALEARARATPAGQAPTPLLLKIAPDLAPADRSDIVEVALERAIDGIVVSNTTVERPPTLESEYRRESGGLSGAPLFRMSTQLLSRIYKMTEGKVPLIGVGGVSTGAGAYAKIRAGASLVQLYTALVYRGPALVPWIQADLAERLARDGFRTLAEAVGADHR
jgi:dihydroorotate dehydrogenase